MTLLELLFILFSPFTALGIYAYRAKLLAYIKAAYRQAEKWTRPPPKAKP